MRNKASVVIVGGGITGSATAFSLAKRGVKDIVLIERNELASGATGRCGAGIRQQWGTYQNCLLARESMKVFENFQEVLETDIDIELKQKGYLLLAYSEKEMDQFRVTWRCSTSWAFVTVVSCLEAKDRSVFEYTEDVRGALSYRRPRESL